jgi:DNA-binding beta-propeller fold protein YncE
VAQDLEPEYIAVSSDSKTAYVTLQENNALAIVDIASASVTAIKPLGLKDHSLPGNGLDASDEDGGTNTNSGTPAVKIVNRPVKGMYQPDAIAYYTVDGKGYLVTANEGDAREWPGLTEESRVRAYCSAAGLDPTVFPDATLLFDSNLGRLTITTMPNGGRNGKNASGQCNELLALGGRSFSVWSADGDLVWDSGDQLERHTAALDPADLQLAGNRLVPKGLESPSDHILVGDENIGLIQGHPERLGVGNLRANQAHLVGEILRRSTQRDDVSLLEHKVGIGP